MKTAPKTTKKSLQVILLLSLALFLFSGSLALRTQDRLAEKVVRLHVLANSDSEEDQALKLRVRDRILERATELLQTTDSREEAEALLREHLPEFQKLAGAEIADSGYEYAVVAELTQTEFPTKEYEDFTLPAGEYLALRIVIGEGGGQNWWCVVFPPLCTAASADVPATALAAGLGEEEIGLITEENNGYVLKFKAIELWEQVRKTFD